MHDISLITTIAFGFTAALVFGLLAQRFGLSPIVGYLLAGIAAGPFTPGFVGDTKLAAQLAEIGVILLMFGVGLHFHLKDLLAVRKIAIPGALGQSVVAAVASMGVAMACGWTWSAGLVLGVATAVASTVVLLRVLMDHGSLESPAGHVAVGWLIVEDLITVLVLVLLPAFAVQADGSETTFSGVLAAAGIAVATAAYAAFGASMALGAFLAGMLVGQSKFSAQAGAEMLPLRDAFAVLFFVSVGMLFDYRVVLAQPALVLGVVAVILVVKPLVAFVIVLLCRHTVHTGLVVAGGLAQIGEFSFILADVARVHGLLPGEGSAVLVAGAMVSICLNPVLFRGLIALEPWIERRAPWLQRRSAAHGAAINAGIAPQAVATARAIVVGYGPVGQTVTRLLREFGHAPLILETNIDTVAALRAEGQAVLFGNATRPDILDAAGVKQAQFLVLTLPDAATRLAIIAAAREINPDIKILTRARYLTEQTGLRDAGATVICFDEAEAAAGLAEALLTLVGAPTERINGEVLRIRTDLGSVVNIPSSG